MVPKKISDTSISSLKEPYYKRSDARKLEKLIRSNSNHILFKATGRRIYQLASGMFARQFISLWELFDHLDEFNDCIEKLAQKTLAIRRDRPFSHIVSITDTARELVNHILPVVNESYDKSNFSLIRHSHFDDFPYTEDSYVSLGPSINTENILIVTDVVASGGLVRSLAERIEKLGGNPIAILSVFVTEPMLQLRSLESENPDEQRLFLKERVDKYLGNARRDYVRKQNTLGEETKKTIDSSERRILKSLYRLAEYPIEYSSRSTNGQQKPIKIDPITVLPKDDFYIPSDLPKGFSTKKAFKHLQKANAISFGFFQADDHYYTSFFFIKQLLEEPRVAKDIWTKLRGYIGKQHVLMTSYAKEDIGFRNFVLGRLSKSGLDNVESRVIKRDVKDSPYFSFSIRDKDSFAGKEVVLLLSTLSTSDKLKNIISLLSSLSVNKLTVLCLVNRMGVYTNHFISTIRPLFKGTTKNGESNFQFVSLYNFQDIDQQELINSHRALNKLLSDYKFFTKVSHFRLLSKELLWSLQPVSPLRLVPELSDRGRNLDKPFELEVPKAIDPNSRQLISVDFENLKVCLLSFQLATSQKNYEYVIEELLKKSTENPLTLIQLLRMLLTNIHFLRYSKQLERVKSGLIKRVKALRSQRKSLEKEYYKKFAEAESEATYDEHLNVNSYYSNMKNRHEVENMLVLCLALLIGLDQQELSKKEQRVLVNLLNGRDVFKDWQEFPMNFKLMFEEDHQIFCLSLMLFGGTKDFHELLGNYPILEEGLRQEYIMLREVAAEIDKNIFEAKINEPIKVRINKKNEGLDEHEINKICTEYTLQHISRDTVKDILDYISIEFGDQDFKTPVDTIRYLHRQLIKTSLKHSIIFQSFKNLNIKLSSLFSESIDRGTRRIETPDVFESLDIAKRAVSTLYTIAEAAKKFYNFHQAPYEHSRWYLTDKNKPSFSRDIWNLEELLSNLRKREEVSYTELLRLRRLINLIYKNFVNKDVKGEERNPLGSGFLNDDKTLPNHNVRVAVHEYISYPFKAIIEALEDAHDYFGEVLDNKKYSFLKPESIIKISEGLLNEAQRIRTFQDGLKHALRENTEKETGEYRVLYQQQNLNNLLTNLVSNIRHAYRGIPVEDLPEKVLQVNVDSYSSEYAIANELEFTPKVSKHWDNLLKNDPSDLTIVRISIKYGGISPPQDIFEKPSHTLYDQMQTLTRLGGIIELSKNSDLNQGTCIRIHLIGRESLFRKGKRKFNT